MLKKYFGAYLPLFKGKEVKKEFWVTQIVTFIQAFTYFTFAQFVKIYLQQDCGFTAIEAGWTASFFTTGLAISMIVFGTIFDQIGCRKATLQGSLIVTVARLGIGLAPIFLPISGTLKVVIILMMGVALIGEGFMAIVPTAGTRLFSTKSIRPIAFNAWYLVMNFAGIAAGLMFEAMRDKNGKNYDIMIMIAVVGLTGAIVAQFYKDETPIEDAQAEKPPKKKFFTLLSESIHEKDFWKLVAFLIIVIAARATFVLPMYLYPEYYLRVLGPEAKLGFLNALNPAIIVAGIFLLSPLIKLFNIYWTMVVGMLIATASMFIMAVPPQWWVNNGIATNGEGAYYTMIVLQIFVYAIGEFIFSPQMANYVTSIPAPEKVGTYSGWSRIPDIAAKAIVTATSGYLLSYYVTGTPSDFQNGVGAYERSPEMMNLILAIIVFTSPLLLLLFKKTFYLDKKADV